MIETAVAQTVLTVPMYKSRPIRFGSIAARTPYASAGQRIGLLGGSFNPPHEAHRLISQIALRRLGLDAVWWIVTPGNPLKAHDGLAPLTRRMAQCEAMKRDNRIRVTAFESGLASTFTAATLSFLCRRNEGVHFVWIMGADCLSQFHRWQHWRDIFAMLPIAVINRPGFHLKALAAPAASAFQPSRWPERLARALPSAKAPAWTMLSGPLSPLSSTTIRKLQHGEK